MVAAPRHHEHRGGRQSGPGTGRVTPGVQPRRKSRTTCAGISQGPRQVPAARAPDVRADGVGPAQLLGVERRGGAAGVVGARSGPTSGPPYADLRPADRDPFDQGVQLVGPVGFPGHDGEPRRGARRGRGAAGRRPAGAPAGSAPRCSPAQTASMTTSSSDEEPQRPLRSLDDLVRLLHRDENAPAATMDQPVATLLNSTKPSTCSGVRAWNTCRRYSRWRRYCLTYATGLLA